MDFTTPSVEGVRVLLHCSENFCRGSHRLLTLILKNKDEFEIGNRVKPRTQGATLKSGGLHGDLNYQQAPIRLQQQIHKKGVFYLWIYFTS